VWLNPTRDGLVDDPLAWLWSSYRDVIGAVVDPWITSTRLARALDQPARGFNERLHAYVSSDPSVAVKGTTFPVEASPSRFPRVSLARIQAAACVAHRAPREDTGRRTAARTSFLDLARACGFRDHGAIIDAATVSSDTIRRRARADADAPAAAWLCLGDTRLTQPMCDERW
jgi:hypothetical protein